MASSVKHSAATDTLFMGQCLAKSRKRIVAASAARSKPERMRKKREDGVAGMGPGGLLGGNGGSRTPALVSLRGGPPPRAGEACGSNSCSFSVNSYATIENATPLPKACLEEAENGLDGHPGWNGAVRGIARRNEFPAAHRLHRAIIKS